MTENDVRSKSHDENQAVTHSEEFSEISAGQAFWLGVLTFYLAVCLYVCGSLVASGPAPDMSYGAIGGLFFLAPLSLPAGFVLMFIIRPLSKSEGLSKRAADRVILFEIVLIVTIWICIKLGGLG